MIPLNNIMKDNFHQIFFAAGMEIWNKAPICRQSSGDGSFGDFSGLWAQEDNYVVVI